MIRVTVQAQNQVQHHKHVRIVTVQEEINQAVDTPFGRMMNRRTCPSCRGAGKIIVEKCTTCRGAGKVQKRKKIKVTHSSRC